MPLPTAPIPQKAQQVIEQIESQTAVALSVQWHITDRCNWRCTHCYHDQYDSPQPNLERMKDIFHQYLDLGERKGFDRHHMRLKITGGEPLVHPDFFPFMEYIRPHAERFRFGLLTNGSLLTEENMDRLVNKCQVDQIQISIEGDEEINDKIRGEGAFQSIIESVGRIKQYGVPVHLSCTVSKQNYESIWNLTDLLLVYDIPLLIRMFVPIGQGKERMNMLSPVQLQALHKKGREMNEKYHLLNTRSVAGRQYHNQGQIFRFYCMSAVEALDYDGPTMSCGVKRRNSLTILPNMDVLACRLLPQEVLGNLNENSLEEILEGDKYKALCTQKLSSDCYDCRVLDRCMSGAMCMAKAVTGDSHARDPQCWKDE